MSKYQVVCSIVVYKSNIIQLTKAINSFLDTCLCVKLIVIDNSPDNSIESQLPKKQNIRYIFNNDNLGYGSAHNIGIREYIDKTEYYLVLNPDIFFNEGVLESIYNFMNKNEKIGLLMPKVLYPDGSVQYLPKLIPYPTDLIIRRLSLLHKAFSNRLQKYELKKFSDSTTFDAPILSGCFSFFRVQALQIAGVYDERFFMYFEDFDLSRRINMHYRTVYFSDVSIFHEYERGAEKSFRLFKVYILSLIKYFNKWGWLFDKNRSAINDATLKKIK